ncbi:hypothetical protein HFP57_05905 [Parasphingopyxis algicola]|uniref:hypothetical protein n=1 Tax=Parasphingopyxis algicola TaxID=2026624 RepID=UPI0015A4925D|nr:hypothetical protein [Parasphingopyxis algicola]QLC24608.1 hypothetical protein HFP57_05905 [Parasphingopyxis algicola]
MDNPYFIAAAALLAIAGAAGWMDHRRNNREHLDHVGWVNWPLVMVLALVGSLMMVILGFGL